MAELKNIRIAVSGVYSYAREEVAPMLHLPLPGMGAPEWVKDKQEYKVYRPATVLEAAKDKFKMLPLTHHHPNQAVNGQNFQKYAQGYTGENPWVDWIQEKSEVGIRSTLMIYDDEALDAYNRGEIQLSPGYVAEFAWQKGTAPDGQEYDIIMKEIKDVNHLALLPYGRGGAEAVVLDGRRTIFDEVRETLDVKYEIGHISHRKDGLYKKVAENEYKLVETTETKSPGPEKDIDGVEVQEVKSLLDLTDEDFYNRNNSFKLPPIKTKVWTDKFKDNKPVLLKKRINDKQQKDHTNFIGKDREIINNALTSTDQIFHCKHNTKPFYYSIVKNGDRYDVVNIDTDPNKPYNEIVDWRRVYAKDIERMKRQEIKNNTPAGGQSHITGDQMVVARSAVLNSDLQDVVDYIIAQDQKKVKSIFDLVKEAQTGSIFDLVRNPLVRDSLTWSGHKLQGRRKWNGLDISIENRKGSVRKGTDPDGHEWAITMKHPYGYIRGTEGTDGDHLDCYLGEHEDAPQVFIIHQNNPDTGKYDEDKVMLGFKDGQEAKKAYMEQYDRPGFFGGMDSMTLDKFLGIIKDKKYKGKRIQI